MCYTTQYSMCCPEYLSIIGMNGVVTLGSVDEECKT